MWLKELNPFVKYESQNWTFSWKTTTERIDFLFKKKKTRRIEPFLNLTQRIEPFFANMTQRIEPYFWTCFNELNLLLFDVTQRVEPFSWKEDTTQRIDPFMNMTPRIEPFFEYASKNCHLFSVWLKELNPLFWTCLNELNPFVWLKELNFFFTMTQKKMSPLKKVCFKEFQHFLNQRLERFFLFDVTQRIEPSFLHNSKTWAFWTWLKQLVLFLFGSSFSLLRWSWTIEGVAGQAWQCTTVYL